MSKEGNGEPQIGGTKAMGTACADVEVAGRFVRRIEDVEAIRLGRRIAEVRPGIARRIRTTASVLRHLREGRRKSVPAWLMAALRRELIGVLQSEIRALEHEIQIARQVGLDDRDDALGAAQAQLATAKEILREATGGG